MMNFCFINKYVYPLIFWSVAIVGAAPTYAFERDKTSAQEKEANKQTLKIVAPTCKEEVIRYRYEVYPTQIMLGDPLYVVQVIENVASEPLEVDVRFNQPFYGARLCLPNGREFDLVPEKSRGVEGDVAILPQTLPPGATRQAGIRVFELPPLEDWESPLGRELKNALQYNDNAPLVIKLTLQRVYKKYDAEFELGKTRNLVFPYDKEVTTEIPITLARRRPEETQLLETFYRQTPRRVFPQRYGDSKLPPRLKNHPNPSAQFGHELFSTGQSDIEIGGKSYDPWLFVRVGNRKPSDPNNPTTVDGWRELEAAFAPSTLRDEITLTRLQLEYYDAEEGEASDAALKALVDWTSQRPEPQRVVLSQSLLSKREKFKGTPLEAKNATLCDALTSAFPTETPKSDDAK